MDDSNSQIQKIDFQLANMKTEFQRQSVYNDVLSGSSGMIDKEFT